MSEHPTPDPYDDAVDRQANVTDLEDFANANRPYGEVTAEDLSTDDLIAEGGDLMQGVDQPADVTRLQDTPGGETIEDRIPQEVFDPNSSIVPPKPPVTEPPTATA